MYPRKKTTAGVMSSPLNSTASSMPLLQQSTSKQRRQRRQNTNSSNESTSSTTKTNTWLWNPFRRRRRSVVGK